MTDRPPLSSTSQLLDVHLTDRWWEAHESGYRRWFDGIRRGGGQVIVTLHDIPEPAEGGGRYRRRAATYRTMARCGDAVVVSSEHERRLAAVIGICSTAVLHPAFAPRPVASRSLPVIPVAGRIGMLGHVHPAKGHLELVRALGSRPPLGPFELRVIGAAPLHHHDYLMQVHETARELDVAISVTGSLSRRSWRNEIAGTAVPVAAHRHVSASGSILDWIAHGRRPLVSRNGFTVELQQRAPGSIVIVDDGAWPQAIADCLDDTASTRLESVPDVLRPARAVEAFDHVVAGLLGSGV